MPMTTTPPKIYQCGGETRQPDIPRPADMSDYLSRVLAVSSRLVKLPGIPDPPPDMDHLDFRGANNIELALLSAERAINAMENSFIQSGEFQSGGF